MYGSCMDHIWIIYGSYMDHVWIMYGSYMNHLWIHNTPIVIKNCLVISWKHWHE